MSDHEQPTTVYDDPDMEYYDDAELADTLPVRPRRKLLTPVSGGLLAVVLMAGGFIGGVQVQKHQGGGSGARTGLPAAFAARLAQGGAGAAGGGQASGAGTGAARASGGAGGATAGTVANIKGSTLYVTSPDGTTVKVKTNDNSKVTRNAAASVGSVHPGDTVVIQGSTASSGTVTASSVTATAKGVSAGGFGAFFPGAAAGGGAATGTTGATPGSGATGGGSASQVPQGFAPPSG
ncbi:hypothetical protein [Baekduia sp.]|jgi:hypothetical protein|uniref:hypothetical protein n=1 Tax=Baekduia sp. TaxID=2600305 RepID=UPI002E056F04|nr:hypothetical protein [Baekduia sp.]